MQWGAWGGGGMAARVPGFVARMERQGVVLEDQTYDGQAGYVQGLLGRSAGLPALLNCRRGMAAVPVDETANSSPARI